MSFVLGIPPVILNLVQEGMLERSFHDGLYPALLYRSEAQEEEWDANTGTEIFMSRPGLLAPVTEPLASDQDPTPQTLTYEQWSASLARYANTIDTHIPTSVVSNADQFARNIHQLGLNAGQSLNRIPRNALFKAYLSGHTVLTVATAAPDTQIAVASINGFTDRISPSVFARPQPVSPSTPLQIVLDPAGTPITRNVIAAVPDNPDDPFGPGTLTLDVAVGAVLAARIPVLSSARPAIIREGGGFSVDAIGAGDTLTLQSIIAAVNYLRKRNVPPHEDGYYHAHYDTDGNTQIFEDPAFQRLNTGLPDHTYYQEAFVGKIGAATGYLNSEAPDSTNSGNTTSTGATGALYSAGIGAETINNASIPIGRTIVTGRGAIVEKWLDEKSFVTEAGTTGKIGDFQIVNGGVEVKTERIRLILRSPVNRLQDKVAATWSISTSFPIPSDITAGGPERFKRAVVIEHAGA